METKYHEKMLNIHKYKNFKLKKEEWDDACSRGSIPSIWCAEKKKILVEDPT